MRLGRSWGIDGMKRGIILESVGRARGNCASKIGLFAGRMSLENVLQSCSSSKSFLGGAEMGTRQYLALFSNLMSYFIKWNWME